VERRAIEPFQRAKITAALRKKGKSKLAKQEPYENLSIGSPKLINPILSNWTRITPLIFSGITKGYKRSPGCDEFQ